MASSLPPCPNTSISAVLATVGLPPRTGTAPPLMRMFPAALRLTTMLLASASPNTVNTPAPGMNAAVTANSLRSSNTSNCTDRMIGLLPIL